MPAISVRIDVDDAVGQVLDHFCITDAARAADSEGTAGIIDANAIVERHDGTIVAGSTKGKTGVHGTLAT
jgi:signal transduction histidine kinase